MRSIMLVKNIKDMEIHNLYKLESNCFDMSIEDNLMNCNRSNYRNKVELN